MSRIGKQPVAVPSGVNVQVAGQTVTVSGKLGKQMLALSPEVAIAVADGKAVLTPRTQSKRARMLWGTNRALLSNIVNGVSKGFTVNLEINGIGFRAALEGKNLNLQLGFSHDIKYPIPEGIAIKVGEKQTTLTISGADRQKVGQVAAEIRAMRKPEPYKGKGIKYDTEVIRRKEGKKK
ncbi:MAG: 50S ribosomal protein L6 [Rhodospirillales bacterium]|nr:50S ribosomal protein L6 [Rhodospirillales bacterium]